MSKLYIQILQGFWEYAVAVGDQPLRRKLERLLKQAREEEDDGIKE